VGSGGTSFSGGAGLQASDGYANDGDSGGGGGGAGRIRINTPLAPDLVISGTATLSPSNAANVCMGLCTRGTLGTW
jgi:hypothetical protein